MRRDLARRGYHTKQLLTQLEAIAPVYAVRGNADIHTNMKRFVKTDRHGSTPAAAAGGVFCSLQQWQY
ncbi:MAG: hypothetical protein K2P45_15700 [Eubacterium sp.]|nr:hypothetical protein [Eubacterium sp.]